MRINFNKEALSNIDNAFENMIDKTINKMSSDILAIIKSLQTCFPEYMFSVSVIYNDKSEPTYMSVFPETSTTERIIADMMSGKDAASITALWNTNKKWYIEIDYRLLSSKTKPIFTNKELTAMLLHEVGHICFSNSIPYRISYIMRYKLLNTSLRIKYGLSSNALFKKIMSLPILYACNGDSKRNKTSINSEIQADKFASKFGYTNDLVSALNKIINDPYNAKRIPINDKLNNIVDGSTDLLNDYLRRRDKLVRKNLYTIRESVSSDIMTNLIDDIISYVESGVTNIDTMNYTDYKKIISVHESVEQDIEGSMYMEFFNSNKELPRIDPVEIDYIAMKVKSIENETDRMMVLTYIHSKIDTVDYYLYLYSKKLSLKKHNIPHTPQQLKEIRNILEKYRKDAINYKIPIKNKNLLVQWADGYEG